MKKLSRASLLLVIVLWALIAVAAQDNAVTVPVTPIKVGAHAYYIQGLAGAALSANAYNTYLYDGKRIAAIENPALNPPHARHAADQ